MHAASFAIRHYTMKTHVCFKLYFKRATITLSDNTTFLPFAPWELISVVTVVAFPAEALEVCAQERQGRVRGAPEKLQ